MSGAERARRFRERRKADASRNFSAAANLASTSTTGIPVLMDVTNEQTIDISIGSATELRDLNISRSEAMQNHWRSADKRFKTVFEANPFGLCKTAITIHKSQGGTFDEVVFNYDKSQQIQLVYVALSRVTSIDGLYLTNDKDGFKFYHGRGSMAPTVKDIRDEYDRMANHRLSTLSMQARAFCKRDVLAERNEDQGGYLHRRRQLI
ncbi:uncharacterized protein TNCV_3320501 [Trichonephila clavipes]|nr:uncharacterized protein TNCV_3320501 [Trichonephila clavipes]